MKMKINKYLSIIMSLSIHLLIMIKSAQFQAKNLNAQLQKNTLEETLKLQVQLPILNPILLVIKVMIGNIVKIVHKVEHLLKRDKNKSKLLNLNSYRLNSYRQQCNTDNF